MNSRISSLLIILACAGIAEARPSKNHNSVRGGTINFVAADVNGAVAVTDSRLTDLSPGVRAGALAPGQIGQKLFQLDQFSVCTIAGYYSAPTLAVSEFVNQTPAMIRRFRSRLRQQRKQIFIAQKLDMLEAIVGFYIETSANLRLRDNPSEPEGSYQSQLLIVGYDPDGQLEVGSLWLVLERAGEKTGTPTFRIQVAEKRVQRVGDGLVIFVAGEFGIANQLIETPSVWQDSDQNIASAVKGCKRIPGSSLGWVCRAVMREPALTVLQMKGMGISLKESVSQRTPTVGGPSQVAVMSFGQVQSVEQPEIPEVGDSGISFQIVMGDTFGSSKPQQFFSPGAVIEDSSPHLSLYVDDTFNWKMQDISNSYLSGVVFNHCLVTYDGGILHFDGSNVVNESGLRIGWHAQESCEAKRLIQSFKWSSVSFEMGRAPLLSAHCRWISDTDRSSPAKARSVR